MTIKLITDSAADLSIAYIKENNIDYVTLGVKVHDDFVMDDFGQSIQPKDFYQMMRDGEQMSTSLVNGFTFEEKFEHYLKQGQAILYIGLSSGLSGTFQNAVIASSNLLAKYPKAKIMLIDSKSGSCGQGSLVQYGVEMIAEHMTIEAIAAKLEQYVRRMRTIMTVDSLEHLKRGGRISAPAATVGGILNIKPTLYLNDQGSVGVGPKLKGKKKVLKYLLAQIMEHGIGLEHQIIGINHGDCLEDALLLKQMVLEKMSVRGIQMNYIGATLGVHGGPGAMCVSFMGQERW